MELGLWGGCFVYGQGIFDKFIEGRFFSIPRLANPQSQPAMKYNTPSLLC